MPQNSIKDYIKALQKWESQPISVQGGRIWANGHSYTIEEYYIHNPRPVYQVAHKPNADGTHIPAGVVVAKK